MWFAGHYPKMAVDENSPLWCTNVGLRPPEDLIFQVWVGLHRDYVFDSHEQAGQVGGGLV